MILLRFPSFSHCLSRSANPEVCRACWRPSHRPA
jgi:hypothetical protein